jgi:hypothetical protein
MILAPWAVDVDAPGQVRVGNAVMAASLAVELADRLLIAANVARGDVARRQRVRAHLDRVFAAARPVKVKQVGLALSFPAVGIVVPTAAGERAAVRIGWYATAQLRREGDRWRGFVQEWDWDGLFGPVCTVTEEWMRVSSAHAAIEALPRLQLETT